MCDYWCLEECAPARYFIEQKILNSEAELDLV